MTTVGLYAVLTLGAVAVCVLYLLLLWVLWALIVGGRGRGRER